MKKGLSRREFLKGAAAGVVGVAGAGVFASLGIPESAGATEADEETTWSGTRYTTYENPDGISWTRSEDEMARIEEADVVVVGSGLGGFMAAMITKKQMPDANVIMLEKNAYLGGSTNFAECNGPSNASTEESALSTGVSHSTPFSSM